MKKSESALLKMKELGDEDLEIVSGKE